jgi:hypothetical protein
MKSWKRHARSLTQDVVLAWIGSCERPLYQAYRAADMASYGIMIRKAFSLLMRKLTAAEPLELGIDDSLD